MVRYTCLLLCLLYLVIECKSECTTSVDVIKLQLGTSKAAQYAGYYVAQEKNYYSDECLSVFIDASSSVDVLSEVHSSASVTFGAYWTSRFLRSVTTNDSLDVINIGQLLYKSGFFLASLATSDPTLVGKRMSLWPDYDDEARYLLLQRYGLLPTTYETVPQSSTVVKLYDGDVDFVSCNKFEEYAQLLRVKKKDSDTLWLPADLKIYDSELADLGMLKDGILVKKTWFGNQGAQSREIALRFMKATLKGWLYCRDNFPQCVALLNLPDQDHSAWQVNEILEMMFTGHDKIGTMNQTRLNTTIKGIQVVRGVGAVNTSDHFDFDFIETVYTALEAESTTAINWLTPFAKQNLTWCWDKKSQKAVLCFHLDESSVTQSSSSNTGLIVGLVVGVTGGVIIIALIFALTVFAIFFYLIRKPSRMKVPLFKDMNAVALKDVTTKAEFRSLLKNYDFVSVLTKKSASDHTYAKDVRRAIVYFHVNNGTLLDMFDFFLVKELEAHKIKKKKTAPPAKPSFIKIESDSSSTDSSGSDTETESSSKKRKGSKKKKKIPQVTSQDDDLDSTLFREDSLVTDIFRYYSQLVGLYYLWYILSYPVRKLDKFGKKQNKMKHKKNKKYPGEQHLNMQVFGLSVEVDPKKISLGDVTINKLQLQILAQQIFVSITRSVDTFPELLRDLLKKLEDRVMEYEGDDAVLKTMSNFVFLRYICAALICPQEYGLLDATPGDEMQRIMILLSKVMQNLANGTLFEKEEYMMEMNDFIKTNLQPMKKFLKDILEGGERHSAGEGMEVPFHVEEAGVSVLYHFCSDNRRKVSKVLADLSSETGWLFDEIFPEDSSDESDKDLEQG